MNILFIDHECHRKTCSTFFFRDVMRGAFEVDEHYYSRCYRTQSAVPMRSHDMAVIWEFPILRNRFFFRGKRNVFVPMYDNEWGSFWQWKRIAWSGMGVVSFCDKVSAHARGCGVTNLLDVRYFPDPAALPRRPGDPKRVFLWERGEISRQLAEKLFPPSEGYTFVVKGANDFLPRERYLDLLASCGVVIAPRRKEGIGMAFLEAMAMGKCVVAHGDATMNEYILDGETGVLFDAAEATAISAETVRHVLERLATGVDVGNLYRRWLADVGKINGFLAAQAPCSPSFAKRLKLAAAYPLYLIEGALFSG